MSNFTTVPDKNVGDVFSQSMWATYIEANLNHGVMRPLADTILGADVASVDFSSIDQNFAALKLVIYGRSDRAAVNDDVGLRFNGDTGANYYAQQLVVQGTGTPAAGEQLAGTSMDIPQLPAATATALRYGAIELTIPYYAGATNHKAVVGMTSTPGGTTTGTNRYCAVGGVWASIAAINRITLIPFSGTNLKAGSRVTLYGLPF